MTKREKKLQALKASGYTDKKIAYLMKMWDKSERRIARTA